MSRRRRVDAAVLAAAVLVGACGGDVTVAPAERAVVVSTTACGDASATSGSGVLVGGGRIVTVAHLVIGAGSVEVELADGRRMSAAPTVIDPVRDLAVLRTEVEVTVDRVVLADADAGEVLRLVGGAESGDLDAPVLRPAVLVVDEVRGTARHRRGGYELEAAIERGDSGAGLFDDSGRLIALLFARSSDRDGIAFAVDATELRAVLDAAPRDSWRCDPDRSRVVVDVP